MESCGIDLSESEFKQLSLYNVKKLVSKSIRSKSDEYLLKLKDSHVKTEHLYPCEKMQEYLKSVKLTKPEKILLFKLRIRMIDIKGNFQERHRGNLHCELCEDETEDETEEETQMHLLRCQFLKKHPDLEQSISEIRYDDIFGDLDSQVKAIKVWKKIVSVRKIHLKKKNISPGALH